MKLDFLLQGKFEERCPCEEFIYTRILYLLFFKRALGIVHNINKAPVGGFIDVYHLGSKVILQDGFLQDLGRREADLLGCLDLDGLASARIAAFAGCASCDFEDTESAEVDFVTFAEVGRHHFDEGFQPLSSILLGDAHLFSERLRYLVLFNSLHKHPLS